MVTPSPCDPLPVLEVQTLLRQPNTTLSLIGDCVGGTYRVTQGGVCVGIFKPAEEEASLPHNPKGLTDGDAPSLKAGFSAGRGYLREVAAYALDHGSFAKVPFTATARVSSSLLGRDGDTAATLGSFQAFVPHGSSSWDAPPGRYNAQDVRRIAMLDLRLLNCDRHGGNILVGEDASELTPIDHGYALPCDTLEDLDFEWLCWPQARHVFTPEEEGYIEAIDADADARALRALGIEESAVELMRAATLALKVGAGLGLTVRQLGEFYRREAMGRPSRLEECIDASRCVGEGCSSESSEALSDDDSLSAAAAGIDFRLLDSSVRTAMLEFRDAESC